MSVYTSLTAAQIESFIAAYTLAPVVAYAGISAGIDNTNYLVNTAEGDFVLTLYEHFQLDEIRCYVDLLVQLGQYESYYPCPLADQQQQYLKELADKPAALFRCLPGKSLQHISVTQCQALASALARFHSSSPSLDLTKPNPKGIAWLKATTQSLAPRLSAQDLALLEHELAYQLKHSTEHLSQGVIHADLFKDNVLFVDNHLTGLLDFYAACCDCYLLDIAIALNDWCVSPQGVFDRERQVVFMQAYQQVRILSAEDLQALPLLLRRACLRFWLSRLEHQLYPRVGEVTQEKDPESFKNLLLQHRQFYAVDEYH